MKVKISFCAIAKNEERCIARCLSSLYGVADEIIVVDTGSTDRTVEIAKAHGAKVYHFEWINDFSAAKNYALDQATGDWVIFLDADEYFPDERSAKAVRSTIEKVHSNLKYDGLYHAIRNLMDTSSKEAAEKANRSFNVRVFRISPNIRFKNAIHEQVSKNGGETETYDMPQSESVIDHDGYKPSLIRAKEARNLEMELCEVRRGNSDPLLFYYIGRDYYHMGKYREALEYFQKYFDTGFIEHCFSVSHYIFHVNTLLELNKPFSESLRVLRRGMREFPSHPGLRLLNAFVLESSKRYPHAIESFEHGFSLAKTYRNPLEFTPNLMEASHARFLALLAQLYERKGDIPKALGAAQSALQKEPFQPSALAVLASAAKSLDQEVLAFIQSNYDLSKPETLQSLLTPLSTARPGVVFLTLFERYYQLTQSKDVNMFTMMAAVGEYAASVDALLARYEATAFEPYASKALGYALVSGNMSLLASVSQRAGGAYARLAEMALGIRTEMAPGDLAAFVVAAHMALGLAGVTPPLEDFASRAVNCFGKDALIQLMLLMHNHECFQDVLDISDMTLESLDDNDILKLGGPIAETAMESAYRLGNTALAERYLLCARENGGHPYVLGSFARFIADGLKKGPERKRFERLSQELLSLDLSEEIERRKKLLLLQQDGEDDGAPLAMQDAN